LGIDEILKIVWKLIWADHNALLAQEDGAKLLANLVVDLHEAYMRVLVRRIDGMRFPFPVSVLLMLRLLQLFRRYGCEVLENDQ
jgi:hypothetical protein